MNSKRILYIGQKKFVLNDVPDSITDEELKHLILKTLFEASMIDENPDVGIGS